jgi:hypothetical protein
MIHSISRPRCTPSIRIYTILIREEVRCHSEGSSERPPLPQCPLNLLLIATLYSVIATGSKDLHTVHCIVENALSPSFKEVYGWVGVFSGEAACFQVVGIDVTWG